MLSFGRVFAAFLFMMAIGYVAMMILLPTPTGAIDSADGGGQDAASRLTAQAQALVARKAPASLSTTTLQ